jgi:hypothetical protein
MMPKKIRLSVQSVWKQCRAYPSLQHPMKSLIITLWFALAISTVWACEVQPLFSPYHKVDDAIHAQLATALSAPSMP